MDKKIVLGLDGGGTHTRVAAADTEGNILAYVEKGGSSVKKDIRAREHVQQAVYEAVSNAGAGFDDVIGLAAGIAGLDSEDDLVWVRDVTRIEGLTCPCWHVNDAVIAHVGAFQSKPGIIAISGTGSIVFGITESGRHIRNYDFHHYAATAARHISYDSVFQILAGETEESDDELVLHILQCFNVRDKSALARLAADGFIQDRRERDKLFGSIAPLITEAALKGSRVAGQVCDSAAAALATGIGLVGSCFDSDIIPVAFVGSVINSAYIKQTLKEILGRRQSRKYAFVEQALPAVLGAVLMAMECCGTIVNEQVMRNLGNAWISKHDHPAP